MTNEDLRTDPNPNARTDKAGEHGRLRGDERPSTEAAADAGGKANEATVARSIDAQSESSRNLAAPQTTGRAGHLAGECARRLANPLFQRAKAVANSNVTTAPYNNGDFLPLARKFLLMDEATLAQETGLPRSTLRGWRRRGKGPRWIRLTPGRLRYPLLDVEKWLETSGTVLPVPARRPRIRRLHLIDIKTLSDETGIPEVLLHYWRYNGGGPKWVYLGCRVRYRLEDVESWLAARRVRSRGRVRRDHCRLRYRLKHVESWLAARRVRSRGRVRRDH